MADKYLRVAPATDGSEIAVKMDDQGDGTYAAVVVSPTLPTGGTISGQVASAAGSATQFPALALTNGAWTKAHPDNAGVIYVGNAGGTVSASSGYPYSAGQPDIWQVQNLNELWVIGAGTVCWHRG